MQTPKVCYHEPVLPRNLAEYRAVVDKSCAVCAQQQWMRVPPTERAMFLQCRHCFFPNYVTSLSCRHCRKTIEYVTHSDFLDRCPRCKVLRLRAELRIHHGFCRLCEKLKDVDKELYDQDWWEVDE